MGMFDWLAGDDSSKYFDEASSEYKKYAQQSLDEIARSRAEGRSDITKSTEQALGYQKPYLEGGQQSLSALLDSLGVGEGAKGEQGVYNRFTTSPGYQFAMNQGLQATQNAAAARGLSSSGAEQMALQQQGQGMAEQGWDKYLKNYQDRLSDLSGMGQRSALASSDIASGAGKSLADLGLRYTGLSSDALQGMGKSSAEALMAKGTAKSNQQSSIWGAIGAIGGGLLGGPAGSAIGKKIFS